MNPRPHISTPNVTLFPYTALFLTGAWAYFSSCRLSAVCACHPARSDGSAWPDVRFLNAFGMTHAWSTQAEPLPVLARSFDVGHAALAQLRMRGIVADVGTVMPAAHALGLLRRTGHHGDLVRVVVGLQQIGRPQCRESECQDV